jgi:hypothetical protein
VTDRDHSLAQQHTPGATTQAAHQSPAAALDSAEYATTLITGPVHAMTERLTGRGLAVHTRAYEDCWRLKVTRAGRAACMVIVDDDRYFTCEHTATRRSSPAGIARIVAAMLGTGYASPQQYAHLHRGAALISAVGRDMRARGMTVTLDVTEDDATCTVLAGIVITSPARPERGQVILDDSGWIYWQCSSDDIPGGPTGLADTVADILTPSSRRTLRDRLAVVSGACLQAVTCRDARAAGAGSGNRGHHG